MLVAFPFKTQTSGIAASSGAFNQTDLLRIPYVQAQMPYLNKGSALFWKLLMMLPAGEAVDQPRFEYFTDTKFDTSVTSSAAAIDATTLVVSSALVLANQTLYNVRTQEVVYVSAVNGTSCTIERAWGGSTAAAINDSDVWIIMVTNLPEGASYNGGVAKLPTKDYNFVSFFSESVSETDVQKMTNMRFNVGKIAGAYSDTYSKLIEQMDNLIRYGRRYMDARGTGTVYSTGGFNTLCTQTIDISAGSSYLDLCDAFNTVFNHSESSPTKIMIAGQSVHDKLIALQDSRITQSPVNYVPEIGAFVRSISLSGGGMIDLVVDQKGFSAARGLQNNYFLVDSAHIKRRNFNGFEDVTMRDVTTPGSHTNTDEMYGSIGMELTFGDTCHAKGVFE